MFRVIEQSFATGEENLQFDDELLEHRIMSLRFWENRSTFVVLGRSSRAERDVHIDACRAAGIPVLRRSSGGGTVVQGPGCLNYSLVLPVALRPALCNVSNSYTFLLGRVAEALAVPDLQVAGSDILLARRKVSGNAQRRADGWLLHHGTLLYDFDVSLIERLLREPVRQPPHRCGRKHTDFISALPLTAEEMKQRLRTYFCHVGL